MISELLWVLKSCVRMVIEELDIHQSAVKLVALVEKLLLMWSHFYTIEKIKNILLNQNTSVSIEQDDRFAAWIIADKCRLKRLLPEQN